jgi:hypothetical protein
MTVLDRADGQTSAGLLMKAAQMPTREIPVNVSCWHGESTAEANQAPAVVDSADDLMPERSVLLEENGDFKLVAIRQAVQPKGATAPHERRNGSRRAEFNHDGLRDGAY